MDGSTTSVADIDEPRPGPGQVAIDVAYAGVNFIDVMARRGGPRTNANRPLRLVTSQYQPEKPLSYRGCMTAWGNLPPALPPHGTVLAWARGCRCEECEREYQRFVSELALRGPLRLPAQPEPRKLDADTLARLEPAVSQSECPVCGALRHQRCRNLAFPQHFAPTHPERRSGP